RPPVPPLTPYPAAPLARSSREMAHSSREPVLRRRPTRGHDPLPVPTLEYRLRAWRSFQLLLDPLALPRPLSARAVSARGLRWRPGGGSWRLQGGLPARRR